MSKEKLYPELREAHAIQEFIPVENVSEQFNKNLSDARIKEIQTKMHELEINLKHYKKILKRWKKTGNVLKITSIIIVGGSAITSMVLGFGALALPLVLAILAAVG